ncbi:MAG TPA: hypothetical protein VIS57_01965 [Xanthomonadales bacterium]
MESSDNKQGVSQMKSSKTLKWVHAFSLIFALFISTTGLAGNPLITSSFSGIWDQPEQESQGIILQIGEQEGDEKVGIAYWFTYGPDMNTAWYLGIGPVVGNEISMTLYTAADVDFMAENQEGDESVIPVGTLDLAFRNCNHGQAAYTINAVESDGEVVAEADSGEFPIKRISSIYRQRCSGGISDDTPADGKPLQLEVGLYPVADDGVGKGKAKFWERTDRSDFKVEVEGVPASEAYSVRICADNEDPEVLVVQFDMTVIDGEGELEFRSPEIDSKLNLNFDPRGCKIELLDGEVVVLTTGEEVLSEKMQGKPDNEESLKLEADFANTGVEGFETAEGEAEFEAGSNEIELSVKIKNVPIGFYAVHINGGDNGDLEVVEVDGKTEGKAKFTDPQKPGTQELLTDPRGQLIEILNNAGEGTPVILEVLFPSE